METAHLQCGSCGQMMAILVRDLGSQVQCPHCKVFVQTPAPAGPAPTQESTIQLPGLESGERESIFAGPEPTDALFEEIVGPKVEMPAVKADLTLEATEQFAAPTISVLAAPMPPFVEEKSAPPAGEGDGSPVSPLEAPSLEPPQDFGSPRQRPVKKRNWPAILLIFLVPYSIIITGFLFFQYFQRRHPLNYLKMLPDPVKGKGAPRQVNQIQHDLPLDADMKVALKSSLRIGDLEVTPLKVQLTSQGNLTLHLRAKNVSDNLLFNPISDEFMWFVDRPDTGRPYTYLDMGRHQHLYGGLLEWRKNDAAVDGELAPGEDVVILLTTSPKYQKEVKLLAQSTQPLVWRVQVRRGLVAVEGERISTTAVIGVEFTGKAIEKEG